uniref:Glucose-6-phosphatase-like n=1 Tax=Hirondellea gigas TaxID=1518452 RepID=A0A6A7G6W2_9CRUS
MEVLKAAGVGVIAYLQQSWLSEYALELHRVMHYSTPVFLLTVLTPVLLSLQGAAVYGVSIDSTLALQVLYTTVLALRINTFRQWTMGEDRPYWWVKESSRYSSQKSPDLRHYPVTCLSSPAAPSHSLLAAGVGIVLATALVKVISNIDFSCPKRKRLVVAGAWTCYAALTSLVATADFFFAAHFPHQVVTSIVIGLTVGVIVLRQDFSSPSSWSTLRKSIVLNFVGFAIILAAMYWGEAVGTFNQYQQASFRWCQKREWMQMDPVPLLDAFVFTGYAVGAAIVTASRYYKKLNKQKFSIKMLISLLILNLGIGQTILATFNAMPMTGYGNWYVWLRYGLQMLSPALMVVFCGAVVPYFVQTASGVPSLSSKQKKH